MHRPLARHQTAGGGGNAEGLDRLGRLFQHLRVPVEAEIIIGGEVDQLAPVDDGRRARRRLVGAVEGVGDPHLLAHHLLRHHLLVFRQVFETRLLAAHGRRQFAFGARRAVALGGLVRVAHPVQQAFLDAALHLAGRVGRIAVTHWFNAFSGSAAVATWRWASSATSFCSVPSPSSSDPWSRLLTFS